ncbi:MAG: hypothetical protein AB7R89_07830 [Dehalococcoidia bacterium]
MARELAPIDIRQVPELARLVDEVRTTGKPRRIMRDGEELAVLTPPAKRRRSRKDWRPSPEALAAALATFGSWRDHIDPEEFKRQRRELQIDDKPPLQL